MSKIAAGFLAALLASGCLGGEPREDPQEPPPPEQMPEALAGPSFSLEGIIGVRGHSEALVAWGRGNTLEPILSILDTSWKDLRLGETPGRLDHVASVRVGSQVVVLANVLPEPSGLPEVVLLFYDGQGWKLEETPAAWTGMVVQGLASPNEILHALLSPAPGQAQLWTLDSGGWRAEPVPGLHWFALPSFAGNDTHLWLCTTATNGSTELWTRAPGIGSFARHELDGPVPMLFDTLPCMMAGIGGSPAVVWNNGRIGIQPEADESYGWAHGKRTTLSESLWFPEAAGDDRESAWFWVRQGEANSDPALVGLSHGEWSACVIPGSSRAAGVAFLQTGGELLLARAFAEGERYWIRLDSPADLLQSCPGST